MVPIQERDDKPVCDPAFASGTVHAVNANKIHRVNVPNA